MDLKRRQSGPERSKLGEWHPGRQQERIGPKFVIWDFNVPYLKVIHHEFIIATLNRVDKETGFSRYQSRGHRCQQMG